MRRSPRRSAGSGGCGRTASELRTAATAGLPKVEMSYIGGSTSRRVLRRLGPWATHRREVLPGIDVARKHALGPDPLRPAVHELADGCSACRRWPVLCGNSRDSLRAVELAGDLDAQARVARGCTGQTPWRARPRTAA